MISKKEFFSKQKIILNNRKPQVEFLLEKLKKHIYFSGNKLLSLGCGTAHELSILKESFDEVIGVDIDSAIIDFCKETHEDISFVCENNLIFLEKQKEDSVDLILCLDIDTNIFPQRLLSIAKTKLKKRGSIVFTERQNNISIYDRLLLFAFIEQIKKQFQEEFYFYEDNNLLNVADPNTRDNVVLMAKKK